YRRGFLRPIVLAIGNPSTERHNPQIYARPDRPHFALHRQADCNSPAPNHRLQTHVSQILRTYNAMMSGSSMGGQGEDAFADYRSHAHRLRYLPNADAPG